MTTTFTLSAIPTELKWLFQPVDWQAQDTDRLVITAGPKTNWFIDPAGGRADDNAPVAVFTPADENFLLKAKVAVDFGSTFDAGVLQIRAAPTYWAKLCFEYSPQQQPMIVSVVTREVSDDCNSAVIAGHEVYLRLARRGQIMAFHYSLDGQYWQLARYFTIGSWPQAQVGFSSQSPTGQGCRAVFSEISYAPGTVPDWRSGE